MQIVSIRKITKADTENIVRWRNNDSVRRNLFSQSTLTCEQHLAYYDKNIATGQVMQFIINIRNENISQDIGTVFLRNIDRDNKAEYGIFIGEDAARGKGYGSQATSLILEYAFTVMKLNKVYLSVLKNNEAAIKAYKNSGFCEEGVLRQGYCRDGVCYDVILMSVLSAEWKA